MVPGAVESQAPPCIPKLFEQWSGGACSEPSDGLGSTTRSGGAEQKARPNLQLQPCVAVAGPGSGSARAPQLLSDSAVLAGIRVELLERGSQAVRGLLLASPAAVNETEIRDDLTFVLLV